MGLCLSKRGSRFTVGKFSLTFNFFLYAACLVLFNAETAIYSVIYNFFSSIMFMAVMNIRSAIVAESTLSFMGIGLPLEVITWGSMLSLSEQALLTGAWWIILIPGGFW